VHSAPIIAEFSGHAQFNNIISGITIKRNIDEASRRILTVIIEQKEELNLTIEIALRENDAERVVAVDAILKRAHILADNGNQILGGSLLAKPPPSTSKMQDNTGRSTRVAE
jgi:DNA-directed RNA polymerase subunit beta'